MSWMTFKSRGNLYHVNMVQIETVIVKTKEGKATNVSFHYVSDEGQGPTLTFSVERGDDVDVVASAVDEHLARTRAGSDVRASL